MNPDAAPADSPRDRLYFDALIKEHDLAAAAS
jgi:hypothetical protein